MICISLDNKFEWFGLAYALKYPILVTYGQIGYNKIKKLMKNMMRIVLKRGFRDGEGDREALGMEYCSINIKDGSEPELA